jgi:formate dehydrogenase major subunit
MARDARHRQPRFRSPRAARGDLSHPAMAVNLDACIQCTRCVRACREEQVNDVIGYAFRGRIRRSCSISTIRWAYRRASRAAKCVQACPTGALAPANDAYSQPIDSKVRRCARIAASAARSPTTSTTTDIVRVEGRDGPRTHERLCVKGRFGFDYVTHPHRLTKPLIRKAGMPKSADFAMDPADPLSVFREATWERRSRWPAARCDASATRAGRRRLRVRLGERQQRGSVSVSEARAHRLRHNNVDHCTRLCHASSVARAARRDRLGRRVESGDGRDAGRRRAADRRAIPSSIIRSRRRGSRTP